MGVNPMILEESNLNPDSVIDAKERESYILFNSNMQKFNQISSKDSLNGTVDIVENKLDGIGEMNATLKKNSLDINILKFLPYRINSLDNAIGNISYTHQIQSHIIFF